MPLHLTRRIRKLPRRSLGNFRDCADAPLPGDDRAARKPAGGLVGARCADRTVSPPNGARAGSRAGRSRAGESRGGGSRRHALTESRNKAAANLSLSAVSQRRSEPIGSIVRTWRRLEQATPQAAHRRPDERVVTCRRCSGRVFVGARFALGLASRGRLSADGNAASPVSRSLEHLNARLARRPGRRSGRSPAARPAAVELRHRAGSQRGRSCQPSGGLCSATSGRFSRYGEHRLRSPQPAAQAMAAWLELAAPLRIRPALLMTRVRALRGPRRSQNVTVALLPSLLPSKR